MNYQKIQKAFIATIMLGLLVSKTHAQNLKLSQYKMAPTFYNPAETGKFDGKYRAGAVYSNQRADSAQLNHVLAFADCSIHQKKGSLGVGLSYYQNFNRDFCLTSKFISASLAKHIFLDAAKNHMISVGMQLTYANGTIDAAKKRFSQQISGGGFKMMGVPKTSSDSYTDLNLGIIYTYKKEGVEIETGLAAYHALSPANNINTIPNTQERRLDFHVNSIIDLDSKNQLEFSTIMWKEGVRFVVDNPTLVENSYFATLIRKADPTTIFHLGLGTRSFTSIIPIFGVNLNNHLQIMLSDERTLNKAMYNVARTEISARVIL